MNIPCFKNSSLFFRSFPKKHLLLKLRKKIFDYVHDFKSVLVTHLTSECEIQIRDGSVTSQSCDKLHDLQKDFDTLQYEKRICEIISLPRN